MKSPTREDLEAAASAYFEELIADVDQPRQSGPDKLDIEYQRMMTEQVIGEQEAKLAAHDYDEGTSRLAQAMVGRLGLAWQTLPPDLQLLANSFIYPRPATADAIFPA